MRLTIITSVFLAALFLVQANASPIDYEYGVWRSGPGWVCSRPACCGAVTPTPCCCGRPTCCAQLPCGGINQLAVPCSCDCSTCGLTCCNPLPLAKTTTCTTVPHSAPICAKTTTCTTVPHPVCGKMTTCTTVPHAAPCYGKTTACSMVPQYIPTVPPLVEDPCAKTICTTVPTACGQKTCCTTLPSYIQLPCGAVPCGSCGCCGNCGCCGSYGSPPCTCCSW